MGGGGDCGGGGDGGTCATQPPLPALDFQSASLSRNSTATFLNRMME